MTSEPQSFLHEFLKRFGLLGIVAALVFGTLIWWLGHMSASPGTEVSILWGMAKYTKDGSPPQRTAQADVQRPVPTDTGKDRHASMKSINKEQLGKDLFGHRMITLGGIWVWTFESLAEFQNVSISDRRDYGSIVDYGVTMTLFGVQAGRRKFRTRVTYVWEPEGWKLASVVGEEKEDRGQ